MRILLLTLAIFTVPQVLPAQVRLDAKLGGTWSSTLAEDEIGTPISVTTGIAPTLTLGVSFPSGKKYRLGLETLISTSSLEAEDDIGTADLGGLRTATLLATAGGPAMIEGLHWQVGAGVIKYLPGDKDGLFRRGGPLRITGTLVLEFRRPFKPGWEWSVGGRYGFHQFTTRELESRGSSRPQAVHRAAFEAGMARYF